MHHICYTEHVTFSTVLHLLILDTNELHFLQRLVVVYV